MGEVFGAREIGFFFGNFWFKKPTQTYQETITCDHRKNRNFGKFLDSKVLSKGDMLLGVPRRVTVQLLKSSIINLFFASKGLSTNPSIQKHSLVGFFETTETQRNKNPTACFRCPVKMLCKFVKEKTIINIYDILDAHYIESFQCIPWYFTHISGQIIIFHQRRFPWNKGISLDLRSWRSWPDEKQATTPKKGRRCAWLTWNLTPLVE